MLKNNYRKIGKKKGNDVDTNVAQREHSNINATLQLLVIYRLMSKWFNNVLYTGIQQSNDI